MADPFGADPEPKKTKNQIVTESWATVCSSFTLEEVGKLFYDALFEKAPALQATLFGQTNMKMQPVTLIKSIDTAIKLLEDPQRLVPVLIQLGERHAGYGAAEAHYPVVGEVLLEVLALALDDAFTSDVKAAWVHVYTKISSTMQKGQNSVKGKELAAAYRDKTAQAADDDASDASPLRGNETDGYESSVVFQSDVEGTGTTPRPGHKQPSSGFNLALQKQSSQKDSDSDSDNIEFEEEPNTCDEAGVVTMGAPAEEHGSGGGANENTSTTPRGPGTAPTTARGAGSKTTQQQQQEGGSQSPPDVRDYSEAQVGVDRVASPEKESEDTKEKQQQQQQQKVVKRVSHSEGEEAEDSVSPIADSGEEEATNSVSPTRSQRALSEREKPVLELRQRDERIRAMKEAKKRQRFEEEERRRQKITQSTWSSRAAKSWTDASQGKGLSSAELLANNAAQLAASTLSVHGGRSGSVHSCLLGSVHGGSVAPSHGGGTTPGKSWRTERQHEYGRKVREQHALEWMNKQGRILEAQEEEDDQHQYHIHHNRNQPYPTPHHYYQDPNEDEAEHGDGDCLQLPPDDKYQQPAESGTSTQPPTGDTRRGGPGANEVQGGSHGQGQQPDSVKAEFELFLKGQGENGGKQTKAAFERNRTAQSVKSDLEFLSCHGTSADGSDASPQNPQLRAQLKGRDAAKDANPEDGEEEDGTNSSQQLDGDGDDEDSQGEGHSESEIITGGNVAPQGRGRLADDANPSGTDKCYLEFQDRYNREKQREHEDMLAKEERARRAAKHSAYHERLYRQGLRSLQDREELFEEGQRMKEAKEQYLLEHYQAAGVILHSADGHSIVDGDEFTHQMETVRFDPQLDPKEAAAISERLHKRTIGDSKVVAMEQRLKKEKFEAVHTFKPRINKDKAPTSNPDVSVGDRLYKETVKQERIRTQLKRDRDDRRHRALIEEMEAANRHLKARIKRDPGLRDRMLAQMKEEEEKKNKMMVEAKR